MDMVFKRYSCPFTLFNNLIRTGTFSNYIDDLIEEVNEEQIYELWLNKVYNKEYQEFHDEVMGRIDLQRQAGTATPMNTDEIVEKSLDVLEMIKP